MQKAIFISVTRKHLGTCLNGLVGDIFNDTKTGLPPCPIYVEPVNEDTCIPKYLVAVGSFLVWIVQRIVHRVE